MIRLVQPCRGHITQRHGNKQSHNGLPHGGQDYAYYSGGQVTDEVFAAADGVVVYAGDARALGWPNQWYYNPDFDRSDNVDQSAGNVVTIRHNQNGVKFDTTYNHLAAWSVKAGQSVRAGQRIATIGATGFSAGKHLHFELLFHPFNFGTPTYGRADPNPYFVTGLAAMGGTITPSEEDDMAFTEAQFKQLVLEAVQGYFQLHGEMQHGRNVIDHLNQTRIEVGGVRAAVDGLPDALLRDYRIEGRNVFDNFKQVRTDIFGTRADGAVDVEALAATIAERLEVKDVAALAAQLQITVKES